MKSRVVWIAAAALTLVAAGCGAGDPADDGDVGQAIESGAVLPNGALESSAVSLSVGPTATCSGTIISPTLVLTASHCFLPRFFNRGVHNTISVHFFTNGAPTRTIAVDKVYFPDDINVSGGDCDTSAPCDDANGRMDDLAIARLVAPIPAGYTPAVLPDPATDVLTREGTPVVTVGAGNHDGVVAAGTQMRFRKTTIEEVGATVAASDGVLWVSDDIVDGGDSGGPVFADHSPSPPTVLGVARGHFFLFSAAAFRSKYTTVRDHFGWINAIIQHTALLPHVVSRTHDDCGGTLVIKDKWGISHTFAPGDTRPQTFSIAFQPLDWTCDGTTEFSDCASSAQAVTFARDGSARGFNVVCREFPWLVGHVRGDFNGDGKADIFATGAPGATTVSVAESLGDGTFTVVDSVTGGATFAPIAAQPSAQVTAGDFNGDGLTDLAAVGGDLSRAGILLARSNGTFAAETPDATAFNLFARAGQTELLAGDFNGTGRSLLMPAGGAGRTGLTFASVAANTLAARAIPDGFATAASFPSSQFVAGDFDGDGRVDLLASGANAALTDSLGNFTFQDIVFFSNVGDFSVFSTQPGAHVLAGDFDGDGCTDFLATGVSWWNSIPIAFSRCDGTFRIVNVIGNAQNAFFAAVAGQNSKVVVGDFDGDGLDDLAATGGISPNGLAWGTLPVAFSNGDGTFNATNAPSTFQSHTQPAGTKVVSSWN